MSPWQASTVICLYQHQNCPRQQAQYKYAVSHLLTPGYLSLTKTITESAQVSWCRKPSELIPSIESDSCRSGIPTATEIDTGSQVYEISKTDFTCPATIWRVEDRIDLRKVQRDWQKDWNSMWCLKFDIRDIGENETTEARKDRTDWVKQYLRAHSDQLLDGWRDEVIDENVTISRIFNKSVLSEQGLQIISHMLFEILQDIQRSGLDSLANSIWLSLRASQLPWLGSEDQNLPDTWAEVMSNTRLIWRVTDLFDLDWDADRAFRQDWLIDRVMSNGYLWYGKAQSGRENLNSLGRYLKKLQKEGMLPDVSSNMMSMPLQPRITDVRFQDSRISRANVRHGTACMARAVIPDHAQYDSKNDIFVARMLFTAAGPGTPKAGWLHHDLAGELAAFDVNNRCSIAIPLDAGLERLPHPPERSMSVCWIVQSVSGVTEEHGKNDTPIIASSSTQSGGKSKNSGKKHQSFKVTGKVKGCWPLMEVFPMTKYSFSHF